MEKIQITYNGKTIEAVVNRKQLQELVGDTPKTRPNVGDTYYYIPSIGRINCADWCDDPYDYDIWSSGNGFLTEEEAKKELARRQSNRRIKYFIVKNGLEFNPDWGNDMEDKYFIVYSTVDDCFYSISRYTYDHGSSFYFKSKEDARLVIDNCEDDLRIVFGVD